MVVGVGEMFVVENFVFILCFVFVVVYMFFVGSLCVLGWEVTIVLWRVEIVIDWCDNVGW